MQGLEESMRLFKHGVSRNFDASTSAARHLSDKANLNDAKLNVRVEGMEKSLKAIMKTLHFVAKRNIQSSYACPAPTPNAPQPAPAVSKAASTKPSVARHSHSVLDELQEALARPVPTVGLSKGEEQNDIGIKLRINVNASRLKGQQVMEFGWENAGRGACSLL